MEIPKNYIDFLHWIKNVTEDYWKKNTDKLKEEFRDYTPLSNSKWKGLTESEIYQVEKKYHIKFSNQHREFLKILHTPDKPIRNEYIDENGNEYYKDEYLFINWLGNEKEVLEYLNYPLNNLLNDVYYGQWIDSLGKKPDTTNEIEYKFRDWFKSTPKLLPIYGHRFVLNLENEKLSSVLSIFGFDTIIYGWNLKHYLLKELGGLGFLSDTNIYKPNFKQGQYSEHELLNTEEFDKNGTIFIPKFDEILKLNCTTYNPKKRTHSNGYN